MIFQMMKSDPLRKLHNAYCQCLRLQPQQVRFKVECQCDLREIGLDDTAEKLGLSDDSLIHAVMEGVSTTKLEECHATVRRGLKRALEENQKVMGERNMLQTDPSCPSTDSGTVSAEGEVTPAQASPIQLKVKDQQGREIQFKINKSTPLRKLRDEYCKRLGLQAQQVRFMVDCQGDLCEIDLDDTAEELVNDLEDDGFIHAIMKGVSKRMKRA